MASKNADAGGASRMRRFYPDLVPGVVLVSLVATAPHLSAQTPSSTRERPALGSTITAAALGELPTSANALSLLDGAQADLIADRLDTGGLSTADPARMGAHGSSWTTTLFRLGPADITDPGGNGSPLLLPNVLVWDRIDIATGLIPLESNAPGLAVTFEPRRPGRSWTRTLDASFSRPGLLARQEATNPPAIARLHTWNYGDFFAAGPIVPGRVGLVVAGDVTRSSKFERDDPTILDASVASGFAHLEFTPSGRDDVRTIGWVQRARSPFANRNVFGEPAAADRRVAVHAQSVWERRISDDASWMLFGSFTHRRRGPEIAAASSIVVERLRDGPVPSLESPRTEIDSVWSAGTRMILSP